MLKISHKILCKGKVFFTLFSIFLCATVLSQSLEFGEVTEEELKQSTHPLDPEADAAYIYKKGKVSIEYNYGWRYVYEVKARIKIYNKSGYDYADFSVPYNNPKKGVNQDISNFKAFTYNLEDGKIKTHRVNNKDVFDEEFNDFIKIRKIAFPNVKEGSVLEYSFKVISSSLFGLFEFDFQDNIPIDIVEFTVIIPEFFKFRDSSKGFHPIIKSETSEFSSNTFIQKHTLNILNYKANNVPKFIPEVYVNNIRNYSSAVKLELEYYKFPRSLKVNFIRNWDDVAKKVYEYDRFGKELESKIFFEEELQPIINQNLSKDERAIAIFEFVKHYMTWNNNNGFLSRSTLKTAFKNKTGNSGDINLMLTVMLRHAGIDAYPILISTKSNGIPLMPTISGFNYVICSVNINNEWVLLDATNKYSTPNILPIHTLNWFGRKVSKDEDAIAINLMATNASRRVTNLEVKLNEGGTLEGKLRNTYTDHLALEIRDSYASLSDEKYIENLENHYSSLTVSNFGFQNKKDPYKPFVESYDFKNTNAFDQMGDKIFFQPSFFLISTKNPFTAETRSYPIDFKYPTQETYMINIFVPEGYQVESLPQSEIFELPGGLGDFKYMISNTDNNIQLRINTSINSTLVPADFYEPLKAFFEAKVTKLSEKITLSKI